MSLSSSFPGMQPRSAIHLLSVGSGFLLRTGAGYLACVLIARLLASASRRFVLWAAYLASTAAYWVVCLLRLQPGDAEQAGASSSAGSAFMLPSFTLSAGAAQVTAFAMEAVAGAYLLGLLGIAAAGAVRRVRLASALRYRMRPATAVAELFAAIAKEAHAPACALWLLPGLSSPASLGWPRTAIYLPEESTEATASLADVLCHELAHLRRRDSAWEALGRLCRWIVFFHPCVHRALASMRLERELACDRVVVARDPHRRDLYAETLIRFGWKSTVAAAPDHLGVGFTSQAAVLNARVRAILDGERISSRWSQALRAGCSVAACWVFAGVAPALWVSFSLASVAARPIPGSAPAGPQVARAAQTRKHAHIRQVEAAVEEQAPVAAGIRPAPFVEPHPSRGHGFHVQNEDEPMFNPVETADWSSGAPSTSRLPTPRGSLGAPTPSVVAAIAGAAVQLGRIGGGGGGVDRDHDHDRD